MSNIESGNKKVWITGSRGFVGRYLRNYLGNKPIDAIYLTQSENSGTDICRLNFGDKDAVNDLIRKQGVPDTVLHLGWGDVA